MKTFLLLVLFFSLSLNAKTLSQEMLEGGDIFILNSSSKNVWIRIYPISMVFNVDIFGNGNYDFHSMSPLPLYFSFINGKGLNHIGNGKHLLSPENGRLSWNMEGVTSNGNSIGGIGRGVYKFEFFYETINNLVDSAIVEWDAGNDFGDLSLVFNDASEPAKLESYHFAGMTNPLPLPSNRKINCWSYLNRNKIFGNWVFDDIVHQNLAILPQDFRQDCEEESHTATDLENEWRIGVLTLNMLIKKDNIKTQEGQMLGAPHRIILTPGVTMTLDNNIDFTVKYNNSYTDYYNIFTVKEDATLKLNTNAKIEFENTNWLILECDSKVIMGQGSSVLMKSGSKFCMSGGNVQGGNITIEGYVQRLQCMIPCAEDNIFEDSAKLVIDTNSVLELPDSTFITFKGSETQLICKENSTIKFGKGSKLIFEDGARISANGCKFVSYDSTQTWDGIYLSDDANDTIKNCVIQNAYNGINISEPSSISLTNYTTEITNCTFKNSTSTQLLNQVYIDGANGILVKGCSTVSGISSGFASCIVMQYCPSGSVVIADNTFSNCDIGITAIQSSPYIARNTITGLTGTGTGLYLDNSNGTIEYNIINNFEKSIECGYSSPYLLKNTFNAATDMIVQLYSASVPVMRPVNSGTVTRWLGGNNTLSGMPTTGAFVLEKESYPMMDSGYNKILTNGYNYVSGELDGDLEAGMNHWQDNPPNTAYYAVSGGDVIYDPVFNGTSLPTMDYYDLNSIGFGMYDSVFVIDNGDNPLAGSLYMQAYSNEMSGNYSTAITKYKDVVTEYKTSTYATVSLARIFNCLEKNNSSVSDYSNIQSYYASIKNDTNNTKESREISEDFVIKSKVRQGNIMEAVSDYENIYQNNQNTHKGTHALLNKLCLLKYGAGGDNPNGTNGTESKINILSLISGKSLSQNISSNTNNTPRTFMLHQNYPNPFNPTTNIKFEIPRDANVSIKVYDLLGREVFSVNEYKQAGSHEVMFDGSKLASGLYFYSIKAETSQRDVFTETKKMVLVK